MRVHNRPPLRAEIPQFQTISPTKDKHFSKDAIIPEINKNLLQENYGIHNLVVKSLNRNNKADEFSSKNEDDGDFGLQRFKSGGEVEKTHFSFLNPFRVQKNTKNVKKNGGNTPEFDDKSNKQVFTFK